MPFTPIVNFAGNLVADPGGFIARFDNTGTYQPTVGNTVLFACPNDASDSGGEFGAAAIAAGWNRLTVTVDPFGGTIFYNVIYKVWSLSDNTTSIIDPLFQNCYLAFEIGGILTSCGYSGDTQSGPTVFGQFPPPVTVDGSLGLFILWTQGRGCALSFPTPGYTNFYSYYGDTTQCGMVGGTVLAAAYGNASIGGDLSTIATGVPQITILSFPPSDGPWQGAMPLFSASAPPPPPLDVNTISTTEEFVYQREAFTL